MAFIHNWLLDLHKETKKSKSEKVKQHRINAVNKALKICADLFKGSKEVKKLDEESDIRPIVPKEIRRTIELIRRAQEK